MARSGAKPWPKPEPEPEPEPKPEPEPEPKRESELSEPKYRRQGWRAHCSVRAASAPRAHRARATSWPHSPAQLLTALTASRSAVPPLQAVSIELRNQPAFCRDEDMDVLVEAPALGRAPSPHPEPEPNPHPNS